jgi:uncharacterized protein
MSSAPWQSLKTRVASLGPGTEFALVVGAVFGPPVSLHLMGLLRHGLPPTVVFTDARLLRTVLFELVVGCGLVGFLRLRPGRCLDLRIGPPLRALGAAALLFAGAWILYLLAFGFLSRILPFGPALQGLSFHGQLRLPVVLALCLVNPVFEEGLLLGYVVKALEDQGAAFAIGVSTFLRLSVHLYQGPMAVASILPLGVLFAAYHWRCRRLWPPILAHLVFDLLGLLRFT